MTPTPQAYVRRLQRLVRDKRYEEAQALAAEHDAALSPRLSRGQLVRVGAMLELAAAALEARDLRQVSRAG